MAASAAKEQRGFQALAGDIAESDFPPTQVHLEVYQMYTKQVEEQRDKLEAILSKEVADLNTLLREAGIPHISTELH